jgi:hypothetical protein
MSPSRRISIKFSKQIFALAADARIILPPFNVFLDKSDLRITLKLTEKSTFSGADGPFHMNTEVRVLHSHHLTVQFN